MIRRKLKSRILVKTVKRENSLYWYSIAALLLYCMFYFSSVQAAVSYPSKLNEYYSKVESPNTGVMALGYKIPLIKQQSKTALTAFNNGDYTLAFRMWYPFALDNNADAQFYTAMLYDMGKGVEKNVQQAIIWYKLAANAGNIHAQHNLAVAYAEGEGVEVNIAKALTWWRRSASQGNTDSQYNLGMLFAMGNGSVKQDFKQAWKWWRRAAIKGDAMAQYNLGTLYANGDGVLKSYCEAVHWWQKSVQNGYRAASLSIAIISENKEVEACR